MLDEFWIKSFNSVGPRNYSPQDLSTMRHVFCSACIERPSAIQTEEKRIILAKAVILTYSPLYSEEQLTTAALNLLA